MVEEGIIKVTEGEPLLKDVCRVSEEVGRREAVLAVCGNEGKEAGGAHALVKNGCREIETMFCREDGVLKLELGESRVGEE